MMEMKAVAATLLSAGDNSSSAWLLSQLVCSGPEGVRIINPIRLEKYSTFEGKFSF